jgi:hypothetical protein
MSGIFAFAAHRKRKSPSHSASKIQRLRPVGTYQQMVLERNQRMSVEYPEHISAIALIQEYIDEDGNKSEDGENDKQAGEPHPAIRMGQDATFKEIDDGEEKTVETDSNRMKKKSHRKVKIKEHEDKQNHAMDQAEESVKDGGEGWLIYVKNQITIA